MTQTAAAVSTASAPAAPLFPTPEAAVAAGFDHTPPPLSAAVIARAQAGDHAAFDALYERFARQVYNYVYRVMGDAEDARDFTADAFLKAYLGLPRTDETLRTDAKVQAWLMRIATNRCNDEFRRRKVVQWTGLAEYVAPHFFGGYNRFAGKVLSAPQYDRVLGQMTVAAADEQPEAHVLEDERTAAVRALLLRLKPKYRVVLVLREYLDYSYDQIADVLHTTRAAIKSLLFRARQMVHDFIAADPTSPLFLALGGD